MNFLDTTEKSSFVVHIPYYPGSKARVRTGAHQGLVEFHGFWKPRSSQIVVVTSFSAHKRDGILGRERHILANVDLHRSGVRGNVLRGVDRTGDLITDIVESKFRTAGVDWSIKCQKRRADKIIVHFVTLTHKPCTLPKTLSCACTVRRAK